jgi:RNA-directed DNA polymerase
MIERIIDRRNLNRAFRAVTRNGGAAGVDGVSVDALARHLQCQRSTLIEAMRAGRYQASAVRGVEIPKGAGKTRLLGIPTTTDRVVQQAVQQVLGPVFEEDF